MRSNEQIFDTLRLSKKELQVVIAELEAQANATQAAGNRNARRWSMHNQKVIITLIGPLNQRVHYAVMPRNLSKGGMGFLSGNYLHIGSQCFVTLRSVTGRGIVIPAKIRRCRHLESRLHDVGVEFDHKIDPREFMIDTGGEYLFHSERVDITSLRGTVLVVNSETFECRLIQHYFSSSQLHLDFAHSTKEAFELAEAMPDMMFIDTALPDGPGLELVGELRIRGNFAPIVVLSAEHSEGLREKAYDCGASEMLFKPVPPELFYRAAAEFLASEQNRSGSGGKTAIVNVSEQEQMEYLKELHDIADTLRSACQCGDAELIRGKLRMIKSCAGGFGFPEVADLAAEALGVVERVKHLAHAQSEVDRLARALKGLRAA
jgi:CheY-like chemotaxis protein